MLGHAVVEPRRMAVPVVVVPARQRHVDEWHRWRRRHRVPGLFPEIVQGVGGVRHIRTGSVRVAQPAAVPVVRRAAGRGQQKRRTTVQEEIHVSALPSDGPIPYR